MRKIYYSILVSLFIGASVQAAESVDFIYNGNLFWSKGDLIEAETAFKKALEQNADSSIAHERLANLYLTQNKTGEAIEQYQEAIILDAENAHLYIGLSIAYLHKKYYQMAEAMANQAITLNPDLAHAQKLKAYIDAKNEQLSLANQSIPEVTQPMHDTFHGEPQ
ncbi:MAG: tetratricopeptide repeat protein [Gammaproteobacteria bacterium]|nr:tetratricopeptide repeat protein [Gammaproteobacteria bacterium]MBL6999359.1 tetratricopeptide repeat protein [Gammaproteobacteria bacterium]